MAKRKSLSPSPEVFRAFGSGLLILLGLALAVLAVAAGMRSVAASSLFRVRDITVAPVLGTLEVPELMKFKGQNIFSVDLARAEARIQARYPQLAELRLMRRYPDQLFLTGVRRDPFAKVVLDGRVCVIDPDGYMIGPSYQEQDELVLIRGLKHQRMSVGAQIRDERLKLAFEIMSVFRRDARLARLRLEAVNVGDLTRVVCELADQDVEFLAILDKDDVPGKLRSLSDVLGRGGVDLAQVKYMDLRFGEPVIGQKKAKK